MEHTKRVDRIGVIAATLMSTPNVVHNYSEFCDMFSISKSTVSEDMEILLSGFEKYKCGIIETIAGAAGGVRFRPYLNAEVKKARIKALAEKLSEPGRLLPGGFLYSSDIASDPVITYELAQIVADKYYDNPPDFVLTMETKGIPFALMTAKALGVSLVIARRDSKAYEGSAVKINYTSGSDNEQIDTMAISRRAVKAGQKALIVDDFVKGGGTILGMAEMMKECQIEVLGVEVMIKTEKPEKKLYQAVSSLLVLKGVDRISSACEVVPEKDYL